MDMHFSMVDRPPPPILSSDKLPILAALGRRGIEALVIGVGTGLGVLLMIGATGLLLFMGYSLVIRAKRSSSLDKKNVPMRKNDQEKADTGSPQHKKEPIQCIILFSPSKTTSL
jgi:hypothetical protein